MSSTKHCSIEHLRELCDFMAEDAALWDTEGVHIETAYVQQGLRYLTRAIEGEWTFREAYDALRRLRADYAIKCVSCGATPTVVLTKNGEKTELCGPCYYQRLVGAPESRDG